MGGQSLQSEFCNTIVRQAEYTIRSLVQGGRRLLVPIMAIIGSDQPAKVPYQPGQRLVLSAFGKMPRAASEKLYGPVKWDAFVRDTEDFAARLEPAIARGGQPQLLIMGGTI